MKTILVLVFPLIISYNSLKLDCSKNQYLKDSDSAKQDSLAYKIYKIDSINSYYIIYANREGKLYKIVSKKQGKNHCDKLKVNDVYSLHLRSMLSVNGEPVIPANQINEISGWRLDKQTTISFESGMIRDLFLVDGLIGLCIQPSK